MPRYDLTCRHCNYQWEHQRSIHAPNPACPHCHGQVEQLPSRTAFAVKGYSAANGYSKETKV